MEFFILRNQELEDSIEIPKVNDLENQKENHNKGVQKDNILNKIEMEMNKENEKDKDKANEDNLKNEENKSKSKHSKNDKNINDDKNSRKKEIVDGIKKDLKKNKDGACKCLIF